MYIVSYILALPSLKNFYPFLFNIFTFILSYFHKCFPFLFYFINWTRFLLDLFHRFCSQSYPTLLFCFLFLFIFYVIFLLCIRKFHSFLSIFLYLFLLFKSLIVFDPILLLFILFLFRRTLPFSIAFSHSILLSNNYILTSQFHSWNKE